jgi:SWI/SNF-related matrix-associated actin-dependent regulator of chromatin subfamily A-like protein 1
MGQPTLAIKPFRSDHMATLDFGFRYGKVDREMVSTFKAMIPQATYNFNKCVWLVVLADRESVMALREFTQQYPFTGDSLFLEELAERLPHRRSPYQAEYVDGVVRLKFPYNLELNQDLAKVQGAKYSGSAWDVVLTIDACQNLLPLLQKYGFSYNAAVTGAIATALGEELDAVQASAAVAAELSADLAQRLKMQPYPFQAAGILFAMKRERCFIADEPGLGKTLQAIGAVEGLKAYRTLVIVPNSLRINWIQEFRRAVPHRSVATLYSGRKKPLPVTVNGVTEMIPVNTHAADVIIINYDQVKKYEDYLRSMHFQSVILDESHYIKSPTTKRNKAVQAVVQNIPYRFALTGTVILNAPWELPTQLQAIGRINDFGGITRFKTDWLKGRLVVQQDTRTGKERRYLEYEKPDPKNSETVRRLHALNERLKPFMIRRYKRDVYKELPPKTRTVVPMDISNESEYRLAEYDFIRWLREETARTFKLSLLDLMAYDFAEQKEMLKLAQSEAVGRALKAQALRRIQALRQLAVKGKMKEAVEWIENFLESGEKLVVYAVHRDIQKALTDKFPGCARLSGEDSILVRKANEDRFQTDPDCKLIVCSISAAAEGITLTAASNLMILELPWTPGKCEQVENRIDRIGQTMPCTVYYALAADTIDEWLANKVEEKRVVVNAVTNGEDSDEDMSRTLLDEMILQLVAMDRKVR